MFDNRLKGAELLPMGPVYQVVRVLEHGAEKYSPFGWQDEDYSSEYYFDKALGHMAKYRQGKQREKESGELHLAHAVCDLLFAIWHDGEVTEDWEGFEKVRLFLSEYTGQ